MPDNRPAVYAEGDTIIYRASALGHCLRSLWAARNDMERKPIPQVIMKAMNEGTELESTILSKLYDDHHWGFGDSQQFQVELNVGAWNGKTLIVRGKMDERRDDGLPVDVKAFAQSGVDDYLLNGPKDYYLWQQSVYAVGLNKDRYYMPVYNKDTEQIVQASLYAQDIKYPRDLIRDRVMLVEEAFHSGIMPEQCSADYACQYPYLHDGKDTADMPDKVTGLVSARIKLSEKIKLFESARKKLDDTIKPNLLSGTTYHYQGYSVVVTPNASRFNTAAAKQLLREAGIDYDTDPMFVIPGEGTHITMTPKKARKDDQ